MAEVLIDQPIRRVYPDSIVISNVKSKIDNTTTSYTVVVTWYDGTPMDDSKVDEWGIYSKYKATGEYLKINRPNWGDQFLEVDSVSELRTLSSYNQHLIKYGCFKGVRLNGYYEKGDTGSPIDYFITNTSDADNGFSIFALDHIKLFHDFKHFFNVLYAGAKGDNSFDNTDIINRIKNYLISRPAYDRGTIYFPKGTYRYTDLGRTCYENVHWEGELMSLSILQCTTNAICFNQDGQLGDTVAVPMVTDSNVRNLTISGNENTSVIWYQNSIARGRYQNVNLINANPTSGIALLSACQLGMFDNIYCSTNKNDMEFVPKLGLKLIEGFRLGVSIGRATNNTFRNTYWEGTPQGVHIEKGEQNFFIGGSPEANTEWSLQIDQLNKGNLFIGVGFESRNSSYEVLDNGRMSTFINCYSANKVIVGSSSINFTWMNGHMQDLELQNSASNINLSNFYYNHYQKQSPHESYVDLGAINVQVFGVYNRLNGILIPDSKETYNRNSYGERYTVLSSAVGATNVGGIQEFIELNYNGSQTVNFQLSNSSTAFAVGVRKSFRKNTSGVTTIFPAAGVTFNNTTTPVTISEVNEQLIFICTGLNTWRYYRINSNNATPLVKGVFNQSAAVEDSTLPDATDLATAIALVNDLKSRLNAKLLVDRNSKQQSTI
ncbi:MULTISPECIES: glycosyl hydrolase family 28-related protein [Sphingobacterium]|uniref:glycosyl hydrolase family 28-related protein n=1 Tax=Sphingobacterium TaxID=28453 RepID=UPI00257E4526|nr:MULTISPECIES: glycosyl hydrolase family 28-related protein [Sphingobacterium]